ncbi:hypothetical protein H2O64_18505 [Kordia sp. YSTF-M3]|uniref:Uncharacterized protein n=1 Tax=Kordia aestuariivivens TaxID=2759037 RepID=A0ABR7QDN8_9FLAO|nr:hypothetical protein [Kordia aestuariivivens]MBC8756671.1 hypothetical protein [Kordia aestuariivivens]
MLRRYIYGQLSGKISGDFSKYWTDQKQLGSKKSVFGIYRYIYTENQAGTTNLLFLNINNDYILMRHLGIGRNWTIEEKGEYTLESKTIEFYCKSRKNSFFKTAMDHNLVKLEENMLIATTSDSNNHFQKIEYPKILKCNTTIYKEYNYNHNLKSDNLYVIDSEENNSFIILNDTGKLKSYPKELFETP